MPEVIIIGAGPAGCVAAIALARRGRDVLMIEQHRFPRQKVCGECLSSLGIDVLDELGARNRLANLRPAILRRAMLHASDGTSATLDLPRPMWGMSRLRLDQEMLTIAAESGARICQPARCERIEPGPRPRVRVRDLVTNQVTAIDCNMVIVADGKALGRTEDLGIKACFDSIEAPSDAIQLFGVQGHYGGLAPIENGLWNMAFSVPAGLAAAYRGNLDALMSATIAQNPVLRQRLVGAKRLGEWLAAPLPRFGVKKQWSQNVLPIGNAAAALEPIGGEGMGLAMRSAQDAADWIDAHLAGKPVQITDLRRQFAKLWSRRRAGCRTMGILMSHWATAPLVVSVADAAPLIRNLAFSAIGKTRARFAADVV
jgi:flavin-dependent dehydrogenase